MEQGVLRKVEDSEGEVVNEGWMGGVTAEHGTGVALWKRQQGCLVEVEGSLAWG